MIRPPIKPWTPPIPFDRIAENVKRATERQTANQSSAGGSQARIPSFESVFQEMLRHYMPETVEFTPLSEKELSDTIRSWLRPAYEQAIQNRREQTGRINAELDADAWSRGMGQSTYLSDVKSRQLRDEARDVDTIESNYSSTLAGHLYDAIKEQQKTKLEVDQFNAEQINHAREKAMSAAQALYRTYQSSGGRGGSRASTAAAASGSMASKLLNAQANVPKTNYNAIANAVARMTPSERGRLYNQNDPGYYNLRSEILYSLGPDALSKLKRNFPA